MNIVWTKTTILTLVVLGAILVVVFYFSFRAVQESQVSRSDAGQALLGDEAIESEYRYITLDGHSVAIREYLGRTLFINSWASWSPLSRDELIALNEIAGEYKDKNVVFIALNRKETKEQAARFLATLPDLPNLVIIIDTEDHFYNSVGGYAMPETVIYDASGELVVHERVPQTPSMIREQLNIVLSE